LLLDPSPARSHRRTSPTVRAWTPSRADNTVPRAVNVSSRRAAARKRLRRQAAPASPVFMRSCGECAFHTSLALRSQLLNAFHGRMIIPSG
jgi:hypothetical protein